MGESLARSARTSSGSVRSYAFLGLFTLFGLGFAGFGFGLPAARMWRSRGWIETPCEILESSVAAHSDSDSTTYSVEISYRYEVGGEVYVSDRYGVSRISSSGRAGKQRIVSALPAGTRTHCYVDPADPSQAILRRQWQGEWVFGLFGGVFAGLGIAGFAFARRRGNAIATSGVERAPGRAAPLAAGRDLGLVQAAASTRSMQRAAAAGGPLPLISGSRRTAKLVFMGIFSAFWNGVTWPFLLPMVLGIGGRSSVFEAAFGALFLLVGLGTIAVFGYVLLAWFNPRPELVLGTDRLTPGDKTEVRWQIRGQSGRLSGLTLALEGREVASYRRGTDTHTDSHVFHRSRLLETGRQSLISDGRAELAIPGGAMPSFASEHNSIQWLVVVHGEIANWPDLKEEFLLWIQPRALCA